MTIDNENSVTPRNLSFITHDCIRQAIYVFLQGAVYGWLKAHPSDPFAARDIVGGANNDWNGTPLQFIYEYWLSEYKPDEKAEESAYNQAAKDVGFLLSEMLSKDIRDFKYVAGSSPNQYTWNKVATKAPVIKKSATKTATQKKLEAAFATKTTTQKKLEAAFAISSVETPTITEKKR